MIAEVVFPLAHPGSLFYLVPPDLKVLPGIRVKAPLKKSVKVGFVVSVREDFEADFELKPLVEAVDEEPLLSEKLIELILWVSGYYKEPLGVVFASALPPALRRGKGVSLPKRRLVAELLRSDVEVPLTRRQRDLVHLLREKGSLSVSEIEKVWGFSRSVVYALQSKGIVELKPQDLFEELAPVREEIVLNSEQKRSVERILASSGVFERFYLYGVTGSGKTEVYKRCAVEVVSRGEGVLILVPEIALTPHYVKRFIDVFGDRLSVMHSALSDAERAYQWERIRRGEALVVVGTRSAIFAPFKKCGLIVVDEEHDASYKQSESPRYNARDVAVVRAKMEGCPVVLGSATPSVESFYNVKRGKYHLLVLSSRVKGASLPEVSIVDMKKEKGIFSSLLLAEMEKALSASKAVMLLLNRKGYSRSVVCRACGLLLMCPNCDVALTPHRTHSGYRYVCHWCGYDAPSFSVCPGCLKESLTMVGYGLQRVEEALKELFPDKRVVRMDRDTVASKYAYWKILDEMERGEIDILLGTQMIAKGHHFPNVALSALLLADMGLNIPDFRASERVYQLICQMAGRAGREEKGRVVIQSFNPDYYAIKYGARCELEAFMEVELESRKAFKFPPFAHLVRLLFVGTKEERVEEVAFEVKEMLQKHVDVIGPSPSGIRRLKNRFRWHLIMRSNKRGVMQNLLDAVPMSHKGVRILRDVDPYEFF
ncbi:MAG: primosomal protein N' [Deferribacteres bacterium]|nr:primosomal protein N' [Deferribacteres bacterium]